MFKSPSRKQARDLSTKTVEIGCYFTKKLSPCVLVSPPFVILPRIFGFSILSPYFQVSILNKKLKKSSIITTYFSFKVQLHFCTIHKFWTGGVHYWVECSTLNSNLHFVALFKLFVWLEWQRCDTRMNQNNNNNKQRAVAVSQNINENLVDWMISTVETSCSLKFKVIGVFLTMAQSII